MQSPENQLIYVGMGRRFLAFLADSVILVGFNLVITAILLSTGRQIKDEDVVRRLALIFWLIYLVLALYFAHTTIGKYLFSIEIRSSRPGRAYPRISDLAMRETVFRWLSMVFLTGYMPAFFDRRHRASSDRWANTVVVRREGKPSRLIICVLITLGVLIFIAFGYTNAPN